MWRSWSFPALYLTISIDFGSITPDPRWSWLRAAARCNCRGCCLCHSATLILRKSELDWQSSGQRGSSSTAIAGFRLGAYWGNRSETIEQKHARQGHDAETRLAGGGPTCGAGYCALET